MGKRLIAGLIVVGLAVGVWVLWPREGSDTTTTTLPVAAATTTSTTNATTTSSSTPDVTVTTTTTKPESHVVETVEEAEKILRALWFGWFEGIYNQDEDRIREVVGSQAQVVAAVAQFGFLEFDSQPMIESLRFAETEILRSDKTCLVVWASISADFRPGSTVGVHVMRERESTWVMASYWRYTNDLWENDCESQLEPLS